jgi:uncharacterized protein YecE (DUF72 family)
MFNNCATIIGRPIWRMAGMVGDLFPDNMMYIGTSGFSYGYWRNRFYPPRLGAGKWLTYYATQFNTVEINGSFYRFPKPEILRKMYDSTPADFRFTVKGHKIITHTRRMKDVLEKIDEFLAIIEPALADKLACVLFQLPPSYSFSEDRMNDVVQALGGNARNVVEFRHISWWTEEVFETLRRHSITFCNASYPNLPETAIATSNIFYQRMHGIPKLFESSYDNERLAELASAIPKDLTSFIYFNNTMFEAGYTNAQTLKTNLAGF